MSLKAGYTGIKKFSEQFNLTSEGTLSLNVENDPDAGGSLPISGDAAKILAERDAATRQLIDDTVGWIASKNLFDKDSPNIEMNYYLKSDGSKTPSTTWRISDYIKVLAGYKYTISNTGGGNNPSVCFYNASKEYISGIAYENNERKTLTAPANAVYMRYSVADSRMATSQCEMGDTVTTYEDYIPSVDESKVDTTVIAPVENGTTVQKSGGYAVGSHAIRNGAFITWKNAKAQGETIADSDYDSGDVATILTTQSGVATAGPDATSLGITLNSNPNLNTFYKYGDVVSGKVRFAVADDISVTTDKDIISLPYALKVANPRIEIINVTTLAVAGVCYMNSTTKRITLKNISLVAGTYEISFTYI